MTAPGRSSRRRGAVVAYRGARPEHTLLIKEAGYLPTEAPKRLHPTHGVALLAAVGETVYESGEDFVDIIDYLARSS